MGRILGAVLLAAASRVQRRLAAGKESRSSLRLRPDVLRALRRAVVLRPVTARVTLKAVYAAGNSRKVQRKVKLVAAP